MTSAPVDAVTTQAWAALADLAAGSSPTCAPGSPTDPQRVERHAHTAADLFVDLSKNLVDDDVLAALRAGRAGRPDRAARRDARAVSASTSPRTVRCCTPRCAARAGAALEVDGHDVVADVHDVLGRVYAFADQVALRCVDRGRPASGSRRSSTSASAARDLGPVMAYEALAPYVPTRAGVPLHQQHRPDRLRATTLAGLDPATTLFIVASKTFGTLETLTNARLCRPGCSTACATRVARRRGRGRAALRRGLHGPRQGRRLRDRPDNAFGFWDWVGGRYSLDSAIGTSLVVAIGPERFARAARGLHTWTSTSAPPPAHNVPALMGLLNVWYVNFLGAETHAVLPYASCCTASRRTSSS